MKTLARAVPESDPRFSVVAARADAECAAEVAADFAHSAWTLARDSGWGEDDAGEAALAAARAYRAASRAASATTAEEAWELATEAWAAATSAGEADARVVSEVVDRLAA